MKVAGKVAKTGLIAGYKVMDVVYTVGDAALSKAAEKGSVVVGNALLKAGEVVEHVREMKRQTDRIEEVAKQIDELDSESEAEVAETAIELISEVKESRKTVDEATDQLAKKAEEPKQKTSQVRIVEFDELITSDEPFNLSDPNLVILLNGKPMAQVFAEENPDLVAMFQKLAEKIQKGLEETKVVEIEQKRRTRKTNQENQG